MKRYRMSIGKLLTILSMGSWNNGFWTWQLDWTLELKALDLDQVFSLQGKQDSVVSMETRYAKI